MSERKPMNDLQQTYVETCQALPACPTAGEIRRFREGELSEERSFVVEFHLNDCAECIELMERIEAPAGGIELESAVEARLEEEIAGQLGLRQESKRPGLWGPVSWLWTVRAPLFVPAAAALLLLALVLRGAPEPVRPAGPPAEILAVKSIVIDQAALRSSEAVSSPAAINAGDVVLIEVFLESLEHRTGAPVTYEVLDSSGTVLFSSETAVLEDYNVRAVVRLVQPGRFSVRFAAEKSGELLETVPINVLPI